MNGISNGDRMRVTREGESAQKLCWRWLPFLGLTMLAASDDLPRESGAAVLDVSSTELMTSPPGANWLSYNGDFTGRRFSSLSQINPANVAQLRAQWVFHSGNSNRMEVTPVVVNGVMFVTSANDTYALDARTGLGHLAPFSADFGRTDRRCVRPPHPRRRSLALASLQADRQCAPALSRRSFGTPSVGRCVRKLEQELRRYRSAL